MIVVGFVLLVLCAVTGVGVGLGGQKPAKLHLLFFDIDMTSSWFFFAGVITTVVAFLGLSLLKRGLKRSRKRRKDLRQLEKMRGELDSMRKVEDEKPTEPVTD